MLLVNTGKAVAGTGGGGFLLDSITTQPSCAFSTRRLRSAYAGNCMRVGNDALTLTQNIGFVSDDIDQSSVNTFHTVTNGGNTTSVNIWYDQSGNGLDLSAAGTGPVMRETVVNSGAQVTVNGHSALNYDGGNNRATLTMPTKFLSDVITASAFTVICSGFVARLDPVPAGAEPPGFLSDGSNGYASIATFINDTTGSVGPAFFTNVYDGADKPIHNVAAASTTYIGIAQLTSGFLKSWLNGGTSVTPVACGNINNMTSAHVSNTISTSCDFYALDLLVYNTVLSTADLNTLGNGSGITMGSLAARSGVTWSTLS